MYIRFPSSVAVLTLAIGFALTSCETSEERAEGHYQSSLELLDAGDQDRAIVELRNVFKLNGRHRDARVTFAQILIDQGRDADAYGHYLRLVEQYPNDLEGRRALGEMALKRFDWEEADRHISAAYEIAPEDPMAKVMNAALTYRAGILDEDTAKQAGAVKIAEETLANDETNDVARRVVIDQLIRDQKLSSALNEIDKALAQEPDDIIMHELKLRVLGGLNDAAGIGTHLQSMTQQFPENERVRTALFSWFIQQRDLEGAEAFLRDLVKKNSDDPYESNVAVVQFLSQTDGPTAARAELERLKSEGGPDALIYEGLIATFDYDAGEREKAIAELERIVEEAVPSSRSRRLRMTLVQMLRSSGNNVGARAQVEKILEEDPSYVDALKQRAEWLIEDDKAGEAITILREALDQDPRNAGALTLMARAHLRDGSRQLAGERFALAVEVSGQAPAESLRYVNFLIEDENLTTAEPILIESLRRNPENMELLARLGDLYLLDSDWPRAQGVVDRLNRINTDQARAVANTLTNALLVRQEKTDESVAFLQGLIDSGDADLSAAALIVRSRLQNNEIDEAATYLDELIADNPGNDELVFLRAGVHAIAGETDKTETIYREILDRKPTAVNVIQALYTLLRREDRPDDATETLNTGIANAPGVPSLMWIKAGELEADGQITEAIAIYEELYERDSSNLIVANNLASLITTHLDDEENLDRAYAIARRLRNSDVAPFQDTYGWIEYRRGNFIEAAEQLEKAAAGLPNDPLVQYHYGMALIGAKQPDKARPQLEKALELAGDSDLPQFDKAREALKTLQ